MKSSPENARVVVGITGASGVIYAKRFLELFEGEKVVIVSDAAIKVIEDELEDFRPEKYCNKIYHEKDMDAPPASGSYDFDSMVIVPASMNTVAKIANGIADNLITRAATVTLKEGRKLVLVFREAPITSINLRNLLVLAEAGATIIPAAPAFYHKPKNIEDLVDYIVDKIFRAIGVKKRIISPWNPPSRSFP